MGKCMILTTFKRKQALEMLDLKSRSVFCLEPIGDSINRKSVADSILSGCMPVFFGIAQVFQYQVQWREWHSSAFVAINRVKFASGQLDLVRTLREIPASDVRQMQSQLARYGGRFQFNVKDDPAVDDALDVVLRQLWNDVLARGEGHGASDA